MPQIEISHEALEQLEALAKQDNVSVTEVINKWHTQPSMRNHPENLYRAIFQTAQQAILVINKNNQYIDANPSACKLLGYSREELLTLSPADILAEEDKRNKSVRNRFYSDGYANSIYRLRKKNGEFIYAEFSSVANVIDGVHVAFVRDATDYVRVIENLEQSNRYVQAIYDDTEIPIFSVNVSKAGKFTYHELSKQHLRLIRKERHDIIGKSPAQIDTIAPEVARRFLSNYRRCYDQGKPISYEEYITVEGKAFNWMTRLTPLRDDTGRIYRLVGISFDISDKLAFEREQVRAELLDLELAKAQELSTYKAQVTSMLAHEFQTPLSVINTSIYLLKSNYDDISSTMVQERLQRIDRQVKLLRSLMERMIGLNYGAVMSQDLQLAEVDFEAFVADILQDLTMSFPDSSPVEFDCSLENTKILTDEELLRQIMTNLVSNAMKYTPDKSPVEISCRFDENFFHITVSDKGIGIPADEVDSIFDFFQRGTNVDKRQGIGVGLMVVQQAVDRLGGKITLASEEGVGTTITVTLSAKAILPS